VVCTLGPSCLKKTSDSSLAEYDNANSSNNQVCNNLEFIFSSIGCSWTFYDTFCSGIVSGPIDNLNQGITRRARKAEKIVQKEILQKIVDTQQEFNNKRKCIDFEQKECDRKTSESQPTTAPIKKKNIENRTTAFKTGDCLDHVLADNYSGVCPHGGTVLGGYVR
jgi:hypothetical protein